MSHYPDELMEQVDTCMEDLYRARISEDSELDEIQHWLDVVVRVGFKMRKLATQAADTRQFILDDLSGELENRRVV